MSNLSKVLVANRGEIACRVMRTCRRMGVDTVAVFSDADKNAMHVAMADEAYNVGPPPAKDSYLDKDRILEIAVGTSTDGIHPGYGFLSENELFAEACSKAGVTFIGPPVKAIHAMGSKSMSKKIMIDAKVPVTPGYHGDDQSPERLLDEAKRINFPVMIKATLGGGGKGMRLVEREEDFLDALEACKREALKSFGDDTVLLERFVREPRHIEFQIFGDTHGNVVHLYERDCSVQRRHQKVLEESPAPGLTEELRAAMGEAAVNAGKAVGYVGAGTVEFLMDSKTNEYFFCEMNTRLQVEHPVTEMVTDLDLVEWQLRVAGGELLPILEQGDINERVRMNPSHAIEARVYAENPLTGFLPATGNLRRLREPKSPLEGGLKAGSATVRVDTGVREGDDVTMFYDPMISKLIVHGKDRPAALRELSRALCNYQVAGLPTNLSYLDHVVNHEAFQKGSVTTAFHEQYNAEIMAKETARPPANTIAIAAVALTIQKHSAKEGEKMDAWQRVGGSWRAFGEMTETVELQSPAENGESTSYPVQIRHGRGGNTFVVTIPKHAAGDAVEVKIEVVGQSADGKLTLCMDDNHRFEVDTCIFDSSEGKEIQLFNDTHVLGNKHTYQLTHPVKKYASGTAGVDGAPIVRAPMPGKVVNVMVKQGDAVEEGTPLLILEAMKMEFVLKARSSGVVESLPYVTGDTVMEGDALVKLSDTE